MSVEDVTTGGEAPAEKKQELSPKARDLSMDLSRHVSKHTRILNDNDFDDDAVDNDSTSSFEDFDDSFAEDFALEDDEPVISSETPTSSEEQPSSESQTNSKEDL
jgi:hypothetical protein